MTVTHRALALLLRAPFLLIAIAWMIVSSGQTAFAANISVSGTTATTATTAPLVTDAQQQAESNGLDPSIFVRQIQEESGFNPNAYNAVSGASGIAQIVPVLFPNVNVWDPLASIAYAAQLDALYLRQFGQYDLMLAAYNAGPNIVAVCWCVPPYAQTQKYVQDILGALSPTSSAADPALASPSNSYVSGLTPSASSAVGGNAPVSPR